MTPTHVLTVGLQPPAATPCSQLWDIKLAPQLTLFESFLKEAEDPDLPQRVGLGGSVREPSARWTKPRSDVGPAALVVMSRRRTKRGKDKTEEWVKPREWACSITTWCILGDRLHLFSSPFLSSQNCTLLLLHLQLHSLPLSVRLSPSLSHRHCCPVLQSNLLLVIINCNQATF